MSETFIPEQPSISGLQLLPDPLENMSAISRETTLAVAAKKQSREADSPEIPKTTSEIAEETMHFSRQGLDLGVAEFLRHQSATLRSNSGRYAENTPGGTALGSTESRNLVADNPDSLLSSVKLRLVSIFERSQDPLVKAESSAKNKADVNEGFWRIGDLVHSTSDGYVGVILEKGLLCSELHGDKAKTDTTPLEADFSEIVNKVESVAAATENTGSTYSADRGGETSLVLRFRREVGSTDYGEDSTGNLDNSPGHRAVFVGIPSTEIAGIQIVGAQVDSEAVIAKIINNGMYIPVYDTKDELIFTPEEFELRSGLQINEVAQNTTELEPLIDTRNQIVQMADTLYRFAERSHSIYDSGQFAMSRSNKSRTTHSIRQGTRELDDPEIGINHETPYRPGPLLRRVNIPLADNRVLHVWEKDDGKMDMFISSLDDKAVQVTEDNLQQVRDDLAQVFKAFRSQMATQRIQNKEAKRRQSEEISTLPG